MNPTNPINYKVLLQLCILLTAFTILFGTTIVNLIQDWSTNDNYSHGFLVPFIVGYMIWQKKDQLARLVIKPSNVGFWVIIFAMIVHILGNIGAELFIMRTAIVITIAGLCIISFGIRITAAIAIPLAYLMFMVPLPAIIWNKIAFPMQIFSARLTSNVIQFIGIPLLREGNVLHLPNTTLEVVDACSGLRSLTSLLALSAAFACIVKLTNISKWLLFLSAIPIAILVNILRLTSTALFARYIGPETAQGFLHDISGIIVFIAAFIILYGLYALVQKLEQKWTTMSQLKHRKNEETQ